ncbi:MAG: hypothetical protein AAFO29_11845, partial [Actinomycetota bacterium]
MTTTSPGTVVPDPSPSDQDLTAAGPSVVSRIAGIARTGLSRYWGVLAVLAIWQIYVATRNLNAIVIPTPASVFADLFGSPGAYLPHLWSTVWVAIVGLVLGVLLGAAAAVAAWWS